MNTTFELNNIRKDSDVLTTNKIRKGSPVVEIFSAMVNGESLDRFDKRTADKAVNYIKDLGSRADNGDYTAVAELNAIRREVLETPIMEEIQLLSIFGAYQALGFDETVEREIYKHVGERSREQAANGDVVFPSIVRETYPVPTFTVSGGYQVDYRRVALGDMSRENEGMNQVKIDIMNRAKLAIINRVYKAISEASGVKYQFEGAGLTKTGVDTVLGNVRRWGRPTVIADYALLSQFTPWAGYVGSINSNTITGISEQTMNELAANGMLSTYNGAILSEMANPYNLYAPTVTTQDADGNDVTNFQTLLPAGLGFVIPTGGDSPIKTWTKGGVTSLTGNDIKSGRVMTRFDVEMAVDVAKEQEYKVGTIYDTNIGGLDA
ncbi:MAG: hypothetical protein LUC91_00810 [Prevotella sp.]|nr:hypothetical protein [Prevotella sp.]